MLDRFRAWRRKRAWVKAWRSALNDPNLPSHIRAEYQARLDHALGVQLPRGTSKDYTGEPCPQCNGTGDVHAMDGHRLGRCPCLDSARNAGVQTPARAFEILDNAESKLDALCRTETNPNALALVRLVYDNLSELRTEIAALGVAARCPNCGVFRDAHGNLNHFAGCTAGVAATAKTVDGGCNS